MNTETVPGRRISAGGSSRAEEPAAIGVVTVRFATPSITRGAAEPCARESP